MTEIDMDAFVRDVIATAWEDLRRRFPDVLTSEHPTGTPFVYAYSAGPYVKIGASRSPHSRRHLRAHVDEQRRAS